MILDRGTYQTSGYVFAVKANGYLFLYTYQAGQMQSTLCAYQGIDAGIYQTLGVSRDGEVVNVYRNGVDITATHGTHIDPVSDSGTALISIQRGKTTWPLDGKIEYLAVLGVALTQEEHMEWHNYLKGGFH
ncbi:hypothetical protein ES703_99442 [subsurface metagenome]